MPEDKNTAEQLLSRVEQAEGIEKLLQVMAALRDKEGGCPWDLQQSYQSILPFTIEEVYEVAEAIENNDFDSLRDELGDLLFQVVFYAQIAKEEGRFDFQQIVDAISEKLVRRHPHVFSSTVFEDEGQLNQAWEEQKHKERQQKDQQASVLDDIPKSLPELKRAQKIQKRAAKVGFDWPNVEPVWEKVAEEILEVKEAAATEDQEHLEEELGDLMFALVNLTRHYGVDADIALRKANQKFTRRFQKVESLCDRPMQDYSLQQLEDLWQKVKKK